MSPTNDPTRFVVAVTDPAWFAFLRARPELSEVDFWRPSGAISNEAVGTPWFYLLRGTQDIVGCGFFSTSTRVPIGVAWDTFSVANGFGDFQSFASHIAALKHVGQRDVGDIGCTVLTQPLYFARRVPYKRMYGPVSSESTNSADGANLWRLLVDQIVLAQRAPANQSPLIDVPESGYGSYTLIQPRLGQGSFRFNVTNAYDRRCSVTAEKTLPALEAAHIRPYALAQSHATSNGLLLRSDIHKLYDQGYVAVRPDGVFVVSTAIRDEFHNGRQYYELDGRPIRLPANERDRPDTESLDWHYSTVFRG